MTSTRLTIGTDPELVMTDNNEKIVRAADVIDKHEDRFGVDGHQFTAELRPQPAVHPRDLVTSIKETLASRVVKLQDYIWKAGPWVCDKPLGGHIHFGVQFEDHFKDALDKQFGILLALVEPEAQAKARRTKVFYGEKPYGLLGDIRTKDWGFEYRTPSSYIVSPGVTLGCLAAAKAVVWEELSGGSQAYSKLPAAVRESMHFEPDDFHQCKKTVFLPKLELLRNQLARMRYFEKLEEGADLWPAVSHLLKQVIEKGGYTNKGDLKVRWKLVSDSKQPVKTEPQVFWADLINHHKGWWLHNPLAEHQEQFILQPEGIGVANVNLTAPAQTWNWTQADPETIWAGLQL